MNTRYERSVLNILTGFLAWGWPVMLSFVSMLFTVNGVVRIDTAVEEV